MHLIDFNFAGGDKNIDPIQIVIQRSIEIGIYVSVVKMMRNFRVPFIVRRLI